MKFVLVMGDQRTKGGDASDAGASGFTFSGSKSFGVSKGVVKHTDVVLPPVEEAIDIVKPVHKKVHTEFKFDGANEINPVPLGNEANAQVDITADAHPVQEVYVEQPVIYKQKEIIKTRVKPHRHHYHKTAQIHGYIGAGPAVPPPPPPAPVFYKPVQPVIQKRVDIGAEGGFNAGASAEADIYGGGSTQVAYTKQVSFQRNPTFFADIFNIPISTLKAVGNFLGNTAGSTNISVQKSVQTESDISPTLAASTEARVSVQTPPASSFIDDIFAIPINTLGAVNKFLENNVPARKRVEYTDEGPEQVRLGPYARRRANKRVVIIQENNDKAAPSSN